MVRTAVHDKVDSYAHGELSYQQLRQWIALYSPLDAWTEAEDALAARYRKLCGVDPPAPGDIGRDLSDAEDAGLLTEIEAADLYDAWSNP